MARIVLVTGGSRSGKSAFAQQFAQKIAGPRAFVATCPILDEEMQSRILRHQEARREKGWHTIEETEDLAKTILSATGYRVLLIDCLTLWVNNLLHAAGEARLLQEADIRQHCTLVLDACAQHPGTIVFVTNEVGWGIVPENALARRFRDLAGRCNQTMAAGAHKVVLVVSGIPIFLKERIPNGEFT